MEWTIKLEARSGWEEVETMEVDRLKRRVVGLTADGVGLRLVEGKRPPFGTSAPRAPDPDGGICDVRPRLPGVPDTAAAARLSYPYRIRTSRKHSGFVSVGH